MGFPDRWPWKSKFDLVLNNISETPQRKKVYNFTTPYMYSRYALITRSDETSIKGLNDIKGRLLLKALAPQMLP